QVPTRIAPFPYTTLFRSVLWNQLAKDNSQYPGSADSGGELGWVGKGQFVQPFEDAAKALAIGQISDPVKSDFGYHIIQVEERRRSEEHTSELQSRVDLVC